MAESTLPPKNLSEAESPEADLEFPATMAPADLIQAGKDYIARAREAMVATNVASTGHGVCRTYARAHDLLLKAIFKHMLEKWEATGKGSPGSLALGALGGYGRRDLALLSDVDLLFLIGEKKGKQEEFVKEILHILFDLNLDLGPVTRRLEDCLLVVNRDLESATAMMECRWIAGSKPLFQHFHENFFMALRGSGRRWLLQAQFKEWEERHKKFVSSIYLLEPNIKEGAGGLRDIHAVRWLLSSLHGEGDVNQLEKLGILTAQELRRLKQAEDFVLKLRNELHALNPRKNDVLNFESQVEIAKRLGYEADEDQMPEEILMRDYYRRAREIAKFTSRAFSQLSRSGKGLIGAIVSSVKSRRVDENHYVLDNMLHLDAKREDWLKQEPARIMALFARAQKMGMRVGESTRDLIEKMVPSLDDEWRENPACSKSFMGIMRGPTGVAQTLSDMHDCGLLCAYIPEFERIRCMVRIDHYHRYTVDEHLIMAVENYERLLAGTAAAPHASRIAHEIERPDLLNFSLLVHDVGKGFGKGHALRGGQVIPRIGNRMGLDPDDIELLRFLVLAHLKIGHIAQRRDPDDPKVGQALAEEVGSLDRLRLLYVHSVCDLMAVSPDAWNDWKATLYEACYRSGALALEGLNASEPPPDRTREQILPRLWKHILATAPREAGADEEERERRRRALSDFLDSVPDRYLQVTRVEVVAKHFLMKQQITDEERIFWDLEPGTGMSELAVCSADVPGSFEYICGALAAKEINIHGAQIFSSKDGYAINTFLVTDARNQPLPEGFRLDRLRADLNQVFLEKKTMEELAEKHKARMTPKPKVRARRATEVWIDNEGSQDCTILEIRTGDRPGLLYQLAHVLAAQQLNLHRALITTEAYGVFDVFYVTDLEYNKIYDERRIEQMKKELIAALDAPAEPPAQS